MQKVDHTQTYTASALVRSKNGVYFGCEVTVTTATGVINIRDGTDATGQIISVIPVGTTAGTVKDYSYGVACTNGIFIEFNGGATGSVVLHVQ